MKVIFRNVVIVGVVSFVLHFIWEISQCSIFYNMTVDFSNPLMWSATFGDMNMAIVLYIILVFVNKDSNWIMVPFTRINMTISILYALFLSFYFEITALTTDRWGYSDAMPLIPNTNIGAVPVIQLLILFPVAFHITSLIIKKQNKQVN
ncbi:hypothetical protein EJF36_07300 [Bacillus sp. HMF5848]|nr:hypothetical protein EJF36_07300 [Bacillus sp. HMF5848]